MKYKIKIWVILSLILMLFKSCTYNKKQHQIEEINILFSLSGKNEYKKYFEDFVETINEGNFNYKIIPSFSQTDTEAILKVIYDRSNLNKYDLLVIQPQYVKTLQDQNLIKNVDKLVENTKGLKILDKYNHKMLENSIFKNKIWSLPLFRDSYVLITKKENLPNIVNVSDLSNFEKEIPIPLNSIMKEVILGKGNLSSVDKNDLLKLFLIFENAVEKKTFINYTDIKIFDIDNFIKGNVETFITNSITLKNNESRIKSEFNIHTLTIDGENHFPMNGSNLFLLNKEEEKDFIINVFEDFIDLSFNDIGFSEIPLGRDGNSYYKYQTLDYSNQMYFPYKNLSIVEVRVLTTIINILKSNTDTNFLLESLFNELIEIIE